jgi:hypothetical protein
MNLNGDSDSPERRSSMSRSPSIYSSIALFAFGFVYTASASNISKTFELGPGTQSSRSVSRTYPVPCGRQVAAVVKYKRLGTAGASNDIPLIIELREPDTASGVEGAIVDTRSVKAQTVEQTAPTIFSAAGGSSRGCSRPWRIRVRYALDGTPPFAVSGTARTDYDGRDEEIVTDRIGVLYKGTSQTVKFGSVAGMKQGTLTVAADFYHSLGNGMPLPGDVKLRFELIDPNGNVVKTVEGFDSDEGPSPRFLMTHQFSSCVPGQWKLRVKATNNDDDVTVLSVDGKLTPGCL